MAKQKINNYLGRNFKKKREADKITKERRSVVMAKIHSRNTKFEEDFICSLTKQTKKKFKRNVKLIKGKPDIVFKIAKMLTSTPSIAINVKLIVTKRNFFI